MGTPLSPVRAELLQEDVAFRRGLNESLLSKVGSQNQFINYYQTDVKEFKLNGSYSPATGIIYFDGLASFFYNSEIVGLAFWNGLSGSSGTTEFDLRWRNQTNADQGSIMTTKASINSTSADGARGFENYVSGFSDAPTGVTLPVLSKTTFLQGESVYCVLTNSMAEGFNCGLTLFYRPIN